MKFALICLCILLFASLTRFYRLADPSGYYFDEVYHAVTAKLISRNDVRAYEWWNEAPEPNTAVDWLHPPLAKYTQAFGMLLFGENSLGWRVSSATFGVLTIGAVGLLAHVSFRKRRLTLLAMTIASLDGLLLSQSRIAMNDIHVTFFLTLAAAAYIWYYKETAKDTLTSLRTKKSLLIVGTLVGLAMGTKWSGIFILAPIGIFEAVKMLRTNVHLTGLLRAGILRLLLLIVLPFALYVLSYTQMFLQGKTLVCTGERVEQGQCFCSQESSMWVNWAAALLPGQRPAFESLEARGGCKRLISQFSELHNQIWWYQTNLKATHPYQSRPWQWVFDLEPVWTHVDYSRHDAGVVGNIYNAGNPIFFLTGFAVAVYLGLHILTKLTQNSLVYLFETTHPRYSAIPFELAFLTSMYAVVWMPWLLSPRIMFFYHYTPALPFLAIILAYMLNRVYEKSTLGQYAVVLFLLLMGAMFLWMYPLSTGYPMSSAYFDQIFSFFPSWK